MTTKITIKGRPISKKNSKQIARWGDKLGLRSSKPFYLFEENALYQIRGQWSEKHLGPIRVDYLFKIKGQSILDFDNAIASVNDILQKAGVIGNDKMIMKGCYKKTLGNPDWVSEITITDIQ